MEVARALLCAGYDVFAPLFSAHGRVDLVAFRRGERPVRVQCKAGRRLGGSIEFRTSSHTGGIERAYDDEIDAFGVWAPELAAAYLVPIEHTRPRQCCLRIDPCANGQVKGIRWAEDYLIA